LFNRHMQVPATSMIPMAGPFSDGNGSLYQGNNFYGSLTLRPAHSVSQSPFDASGHLEHQIESFDLPVESSNALDKPLLEYSFYATKEDPDEPSGQASKDTFNQMQYKVGRRESRKLPGRAASHRRSPDSAAHGGKALPRNASHPHISSGYGFKRSDEPIHNLARSPILEDFRSNKGRNYDLKVFLYLN
jgi:hypothetical protein